MEFQKEITECLQELKEELDNFKNAEGSEAEIEALKEMLDAFMRGTQNVRTYIDRYNDRRYRR